MATAALTEYPQKGVAVVSWSLDADEAGDPATIARWHEKCIQVVDDPGTSLITVEGSNNGTDWATLHSKDSNAVASGDGGGLVALSGIDTGLYTILENPLYIRAVAADGDTNGISVILVGVAFD